MNALVSRRVRPVTVFVLTLLVIELLDETVFGLHEAAWPLIQADLGLTYAQIGLMLMLPELLANFIEPWFGILADMGKLRVLILGGGIFFALALIGIGLSQSVIVLLLSTILFYPSSGAFVSLAQAALMNIDSSRHEQNMARWTVAGSLGVMIGPLMLSLMIGLGFGWRGGFIMLGVIALTLVVVAWRQSFPSAAHISDEDDQPSHSFREGVRLAISALRRREVLRWLVLLEFADLLMDILLSFLALYMVNVVGIPAERAAFAVTVWTGIGLVGDFLLIPLLERVRGLTYLRYSALIEFMLYPAFLLIDHFALKLVILGLLGFFNAGWYSILQGQLYSSMPGRSGTVLAAANAVGLIGSFIPLGLGIIAGHFGLQVTMWLLLLGPIALMIGLPYTTTGVSNPGGHASESRISD